MRADRFTGKVAFFIGASSNIGGVTAKGFAAEGAKEEMPENEWERIVPVNGCSYYIFTSLIIPRMAEQGGSAVVNR